MAIWLLSVGATLASPCEDVEAIVLDVEQSVMQLRLAQATLALERAEEALSCGAHGSSELLGRMWLAEGVLHEMQGDQAASAAAFAAAGRAHPDGWDATYGEAMEARYRSALVAPGGVAWLDVAPVPVPYEARLDGAPAAFPAEIPSGIHLVQVGPADAPALFGQIVDLAPGDRTELYSGLTPPVSELDERPELAAGVEASRAVSSPPVDLAGALGVPVSKPAPPSRRAGLVVGAVAGGAALGAALMTIPQTSKMRSAEDVEGLNQAFKQQKTWAYTSYSLLGVATAGIALHFAL